MLFTLFQYPTSKFTSNSSNFENWKTRSHQSYIYMYKRFAILIHCLIFLLILSKNVLILLLEVRLINLDPLNQVVELIIKVCKSAFIHPQLLSVRQILRVWLYYSLCLLQTLSLGFKLNKRRLNLEIERERVWRCYCWRRMGRENEEEKERRRVEFGGGWFELEEGKRKDEENWIRSKGSGKEIVG